MKSVKVWLVIALVFVAGFGSGIVATRAVGRRVVQRLVNDPDALRKIVASRLARKLDLDRDQKAKVDQILSRTQSDLKGLREEFGPRFQSIMVAARDDISAVLTPEQEERFRKFREENRRLWQMR
jgi:hypothetical protein